MSSPPTRSPVPRLALRSEEAAEACGVSQDFFRAHVASELRAVRRSRLKLYPVAEIVRWLDHQATLTLDRE